MKQPWAVFLALFLHLALISILVISWQQQHSILLSQANNPVVWLAKQTSRPASLKQKLFLHTNNHKNILFTQKKSSSQSLVTAHSQPPQTLPVQNNAQANNFIKMLHDEIANQLLQNIRDNDIAVNQNYSLIVSFQISSNGQITNITLSAPQPLPAWLSTLAERSLHEISPISPPNTQLGNNAYQIPINLELTQ